MPNLLPGDRRKAARAIQVDRTRAIIREQFRGLLHAVLQACQTAATCVGVLWFFGLIGPRPLLVAGLFLAPVVWALLVIATRWILYRRSID